jgi:hypothetical protein
MSSLLDQTAGAGRRLLALPAAVRMPRYLPLLLVLAAAVLLRHVVAVDPDVSWLLTVAERALDGQRLYVDVIEANPPASVILYMPPVAIARAIGLPPEILVDGLVLLAACGSLWLAGRILARARLLDTDRWPLDCWYLAARVAVILIILPAQTFGNRDHIALIAFLPAFAVYAARSKGVSPGLASAIIAGIAAGVTVVIKPYFVVPVLACAGVAAVWAKSWRVVLAVENWTAGAVTLAYAVTVLVAYPAYVTDMVPLVAAVYVAVRPSFLELIRDVAIPLWVAALVLIVSLKRKAVLDPPFCLVLTASCGFALAFLIQGKGWAYQSYPMLALVLIALVLALVPSWRAASAASASSASRIGRLVHTLAAGAIVALSLLWMNHAPDTSALAETIRRLKPRPTMLAISSEIAVGHPLVREVGGTWVGRVCSLWISTGVLLRRQFETLDPATAARLTAYEARDRAMLTADIARARPDIILLEGVAFDWGAWARSDPALAEQLKHYREAGALYGITILARHATP